MQPLLRDPAPFVAHVAAQTLTSSQDLRFAGPVLDWVLRQDRYQRERLLRVLEGFGPDLLPWLEANLEAPETDPEPWIIFALLAGSQRHRESQPRLLDLLAIPSLDLQASTLKALAALADPTVYPQVLPLAAHDAWEIRAQAARALGVLGGPEAIPDLIRLTGGSVSTKCGATPPRGSADLGHAGSRHSAGWRMIPPPIPSPATWRGSAWNGRMSGGTSERRGGPERGQRLASSLGEWGILLYFLALQPDATSR